MYDKLPRVRYITPQGYKEVSDITTTFRVTQKVIEEGAYPIDVSIPETDRPEVFAHRVYGNPRLHWVILNLNNKVNPFYEWVLSPQAFENYMAEKYPGYTLFLTDISGLRGFTGSFRTNDIVFSTGSTLASAQPSISDSLKNARVVSYDPVYCRLVIEFTQKTAWVPVEGEYVAGQNTDVLGNKTYYVARIGKVLESQFAAHHFVNSDGETLDPRIPIQYHNKFMETSDFGFTFGATPLGRYIIEDFGNYTVTNREHEIAVNDQNRNITMVSKSYLNNIERDVELLLNG